jgi:hypothetical protein
VEVLISIVSTLSMLILCRLAARRWAKSGTEAVMLGVVAGVATTFLVLATAIVIFMIDPNAFKGPMLEMRVTASILLGPASGALMTVMLWRRAQSG